MTNLAYQLNKRRKVIYFIIIFFSSLAIVFHFNYEITPLQYFDGRYNMSFIYGLMVYKLIELPLLYYILIHRHLLYIRKNESFEKVFLKLEKQSKVLFFLIVQGNTIFGIISYKLSADIFYFLFFMFIALLTTILIKPNKLFF